MDRAAPIGMDTPGADRRDPSWQIERRTEILRFTAELERQTILPNFLAVAIIVGFAQMLPNGRDFILPGILRALVVLATSFVYRRIRKRIALRKGLDGLYHLCIGVGIIAGTSWALLLVPALTEPVLSPAAFLVFASVMIAISLVVTSTSSLWSIWIPYVLSFLIVMWLMLLAQGDEFSLQSAFGITVVFIAVAIFSRGTAAQRVDAADTIVENRRLGEELTEALAQSEFLANRDPLTGLLNRRAMFEQPFAQSSDLEQRHILLIDIDHFKQVNDRFGHDMGDRMLVRIAEVLRDAAREVEGEGHRAARLGGEEFAVFLAVEDTAKADAIAEEIRAAISDVAQRHDMPDGLARSSIGVTTFARSEHIGEAMQRADKALYAAKSAGRDTIVRRET